MRFHKNPSFLQPSIILAAEFIHHPSPTTQYPGKPEKLENVTTLQ